MEELSDWYLMQAIEELPDRAAPISPGLKERR